MKARNDQFGEGDSRLKEAPILEKKKLLKLEEVRRVMKKNPMMSQEEALKNRNSIKTLSLEVEAVLERQQAISSIF